MKKMNTPKQKISVLGCGWLGLPLASFLLNEGYAVKGSTTLPGKMDTLAAANITPFRIHINESKIEGDIQEFLNSEVLIVNIPPKRLPDIEEVYPRQIELLLEKAKSSPVNKVLVVSATSVYGSSDITIDEETAPNPDKPTGMAVLKAEKVFRNARPFQTTIVRFGGLIGPGRNPGRFLAGKENVSGGGDPVNLVHLDDCIGIVHTIIRKSAWGMLFNGCAPGHPSRKDFYTQAAQKAGLVPPTFKADIAGSSRKLIDGSKISKMLEYRYRHADLMATIDAL